MKPESFVFIGRSGCGKGTQVKLLIDYLDKRGDFPSYSIESGAFFRSFIQEKGYTNSLARHIQEGGGLQPEFLSIWVWTNLLIRDFQDPNHHLIFDGMPRKEHEGPVFDAALDFYGREKRNIVYLNVSREWSEERMLARKRVDDTDEYIKRRLDWFETDVMPVIEYFRSNKKYNFLDINGEQTVEAVHRDIIVGVEKNGIH